MGKIIGAILGFLFLGGPVGLLIGLFIGFIFDSNVKLNFFSNSGHTSNSIVIDAFPILASEIINAGNVDKISILKLKNIVIEVFGTASAKDIMSKIKYYIENGYTQYKVDEMCEYVYMNSDTRSRINLVNLLFTIIKNRNTFTADEMRVLNRISSKIGVTLNNFNSQSDYGYEDYYNYDNYHQRNYYQNDRKDYYKILEIDRNSTDDEIKKQYRNLCKKYHPDRSMNLSENEKKTNENKMKEIIDAYEEIKKERNMR